MAGSAWNWIYGLTSLFGIGVIFIIFQQVFKVYLIPSLTTSLNATAGVLPATQADILAQYAKYMVFFDLMPYILFLAIVVYMILASMRREAEGGYG